MVRGSIKKTNTSLMKPTSMGGVEKTWMVINMTINGMVVMAAFPRWQCLLALPVFIIFHVIGRAIFKADPCFFEIFQKYNRYSRKTTKYLPAQRSNMSTGFLHVPRSVVVSTIKKVKKEDEDVVRK